MSTLQGQCYDVCPDFYYTNYTLVMIAVDGSEIPVGGDNADGGALPNDTNNSGTFERKTCLREHY